MRERKRIEMKEKVLWVRTGVNVKVNTGEVIIEEKEKEDKKENRKKTGGVRSEKGRNRKL